MKLLKTLVITLLLTVSAFLVHFTVQATEVNSDDELLRALRDESVDTITLNYRDANLSEFVTVERNITIDGNGASLTAGNGICLTFAQGTSLTLRDLTITGVNDFVIKSYGSVSLEGNIEFANGYGLLMNNGSSLVSNANIVSRTNNKIAIGANTNGGEITLNNIRIDDTTTSGILLYIYRGGGALRLSGTHSYNSTYGTAVYAANGKSEEQSIVLEPYASITVKAENAKSGDESAAGFNVRECALIMKKGSQLNVTGAVSAVYCDILETEAECIITAENTVPSDSYGAVTVFGKVSGSPYVGIGEKNALSFKGCGGLAVFGCDTVKIGNNSVISSKLTGGCTISTSGSILLGDSVTVNSFSDGQGIYAKGGFACGTDCDITLDPLGTQSQRGIGSGGEIKIGSYSVVKCRSAKKAIAADEAVTFSEYATIDCENVDTAVSTMRGVQTGKGCMITVKNAEKYGIYASGTLLADAVTFGEENTINIETDGTAVYSGEAVIINKGSNAIIETGNSAPAIQVDTSLTTQGYMRVTASNVTVKSKLSADSGDAALNIVGSVIAEDGAKLSVECDSAFAVLCRAGDLIAGTGSAIYVSGGCGAFVEDGNIRISQGSGLYAKGTHDSGVRVSNGMLHVGKESSIITEGERFGAEMLVSGGIWLENPKLFDFRSTTSVAVYIEDGVFNAADTAVLSAWYRAPNKSNEETWWKTDVSEYKAWEISSRLAESQLGYADYTQRSANGTVHFKNGAEISSEGFNANVGEFRAGEATRISAFKTRPVSSANYLFIPAGRSFSWQLEASSVEGEGEVFEILEEPKAGTVSLGKNGTLSYSATESSRGEQKVVYQVTAQDGAVSLPVEVIINVTRSKPPAAYNHTFDVLANGSLINNVTATDFDGSIASLAITKQPEHGTVSIASDGTIMYTPEGTYVGLDSFCYTATDNDSDQSNEAVVTLLVGMKGETTARNATYIAAKNEDTVGVLKVDLPKDTAIDHIEITKYPQYGELTLEGIGFIYSPPENFAGTETFSFAAVNEHGIKSNEAVVSIITVPSEKPRANALKIDCAAGKGYSGRLSAQDLDGKITTYMIDTYPQHGKFEFDASNGKFTYTAESGYTGTDIFTFYVYDDEGLKSEVVSVSISVDTYINMLKASGDLTRIIIIAVVSLAVIITMIVIIITGTVRKRRKLDREYEAQYGDSGYDDYYGF